MNETPSICFPHEAQNFQESASLTPHSGQKFQRGAMVVVDPEVMTLMKFPEELIML